MPNERYHLVLNPFLRLLLVMAIIFLIKFELLNSLISHYLLILQTFDHLKIHPFVFKELLVCRIYQNSKRFRLLDFQIFLNLFYHKSLKLFQAHDLSSHIESSLFTMDYLNQLIQFVSQFEPSCSYPYRNSVIHVLIIMPNKQYLNLDYLYLNQGFNIQLFKISLMNVFVLEQNSLENPHFYFEIYFHLFLLFEYLRIIYLLIYLLSQSLRYYLCELDYHLIQNFLLILKIKEKLKQVIINLFINVVYYQYQKFSSF